MAPPVGEWDDESNDIPNIARELDTITIGGTYSNTAWATGVYPSSGTWQHTSAPLPVEIRGDYNTSNYPWKTVLLIAMTQLFAPLLIILSKFFKKPMGIRI